MKRASSWKLKAALLALLIAGSQSAHAWHGLAHYYIGETNTLRPGMGSYSNWPDVFGLASEEFVWSHDIEPDVEHSGWYGEYGESCRTGLPASYALFLLATNKINRDVNWRTKKWDRPEKAQRILQPQIFHPLVLPFTISRTKPYIMSSSLFR